jgi:5'-deoxynucleotidase YfbR-like HD superfamily hydrolase
MTIEELYSAKAKELCRYYAIAFRMLAPRAICSRYSYPGSKRAVQFLVQSLAEHSYLLSKLAPAVYMEFRDMFRIKNLPPQDLSFYGIIHDDAEAITGDSATDVDGVTKEVKDWVEHGSLGQLYGNLACRDFMLAQHARYEMRDEYPTQIIKMLDSIELVLFSQLCVRNGIGMIKQTTPEQYLLVADGQDCVVDPRTHLELSECFCKDGLVITTGETLFKGEGDNADKVPISRVMYEHSLVRLKKRFDEQAPELVAIFEIISKEAASFPFEEYNFKNMPAIFAK